MTEWTRQRITEAKLKSMTGFATELQKMLLRFVTEQDRSSPAYISAYREALKALGAVPSGLPALEAEVSEAIIRREIGKRNDEGS